MKAGNKSAVIFIMLTLLFTACSNSEASESEPSSISVPTSEPSLPEESDTRVPTNRPTSAVPPGTPTSTPLALPAQLLSDEGPWLVFNDTSGIWTLNPDGTGLTRLVDHPMTDPPMGMNIYPASTGGYVAFLEFQTNFYAMPSIYLLSLHDAEWRLLARPLSAEIEEAAEEDYSGYEDVIAVAGPWNQLAWSPDGSRLVYVGAVEGRYSDILVFDLSTDKITRLTNDPAYSISPSWSPDNSSIVVGSASSLGWGSSGWGYSMDSLSAVIVDSAGMRNLYSSEVGIGYESLLGWTSDRTFLVDSLSFMCSYQNLRSVNVDTGDVRVVWGDGYDERAFDPESKMVVFIVLDKERNRPECAPETEAGIYLLDAQSSTLMLITTGTSNLYDQVFWSAEAGQFFLYGDSNIMTISPEGDWSEYPAPELGYSPLAIAPNGERWAMIASDGIWIGSMDGELLEIYAGEAHHPTWNLDGEILFFFAEEEFSVLYMAQHPNYEPIVIFDEIVEDPVWGNVSHLEWVWP